jgi:hypothetical protein
MFDTLSDRIKQDEKSNGKEKIIRIVLYVVVAVVLFGSLYLVAQHLS